MKRTRVDDDAEDHTTPGNMALDGRPPNKSLKSADATGASVTHSTTDNDNAEHSHAHPTTHASAVPMENVTTGPSTVADVTVTATTSNGSATEAQSAANTANTAHHTAHEGDDAEDGEIVEEPATGGVEAMKMTESGQHSQPASSAAVRSPSSSRPEHVAPSTDRAQTNDDAEEGQVLERDAAHHAAKRHPTATMSSSETAPPVSEGDR
jgi:hypothetical protein